MRRVDRAVSFAVASVNKRQFMKCLDAAMKRAKVEMRPDPSASHIERGLASEGYMGGYCQALQDVDAMLTHGYPSDPRRVWKDHG